MTAPSYIQTADIEGRLDWRSVVAAIEDGHKKPSAQIGDLFLTSSNDTLLNRAAWIDGVGIGLKTVTVMSKNFARGLPSVQGIMIVFDGETGTPKALIDSKLVTWWKTAADSLLGALKLARPQSRNLLILGAGEVAKSLAHAYSALFPQLERISIWNRTASNALNLIEKLREDGINAIHAEYLETAVGEADIISSATMSHDPVLKGEWLKPGTHLDLVGAFRDDMREVDDAAILKSRIFVDSRATTLDHIGELKIPLAKGLIRREDIIADLYELVAGKAGRLSEQDITLFKNGGGAHLDLMTAGAILRAYEEGNGSAI